MLYIISITIGIWVVNQPTQCSMSCGWNNWFKACKFVKTPILNIIMRWPYLQLQLNPFILNWFVYFRLQIIEDNKKPEAYYKTKQFCGFNRIEWDDSDKTYHFDKFAFRFVQITETKDFICHAISKLMSTFTGAHMNECIICNDQSVCGRETEKREYYEMPLEMCGARERIHIWIRPILCEWK